MSSFRSGIVLGLSILAMAAVAPAQENPYSGFNKLAYGTMKAWILGAAEKMPEENYGFKPADSVRSFGQIVGHAADAQYMFCSIVLGEKNPGSGVEKSKTSKADLIAALKEAGAYCDKAYNNMTDASGAETVKMFGGRDLSKLGALTANCLHLSEHYGNLVVYLRMKNIVPPSTENPPTAAPAKK